MSKDTKGPKSLIVKLMRRRRLRKYGDTELKIFEAGDTVTVATKDAYSLFGAQVAQLVDDDGGEKARSAKGQPAELGPASPEDGKGEDGKGEDGKGKAQARAAS